MNIDIFTVCEGCDIGLDGAVIIYRSMSQWVAESFPFMLSKVIVFRVELSDQDEGERAFRVSIFDEDFEELKTITGQIGAQLVPGREFGTLSWRQAIILPLKRPTLLTVRLDIEGMASREVHFTVLGPDGEGG